MLIPGVTQEKETTSVAATVLTIIWEEHLAYAPVVILCALFSRHTNFPAPNKLVNEAYHKQT